MKVNRMLRKLSERIPLKTLDGSIYKLSPRQFRTAVISDMVS